MWRQERLTEQARDVLNQAQSLAVQYRHQQIDVAHVFSALLQHEGGTPTEILRKLGVDPELVQRRVESLLSSFLKSERATTQLYPTPEFLELGANADAEATRLKDDYIAAEHILIAFTKIENGAISLNLYRIIQELFNNTLKHANASIVTIELTQSKENQLSLIYEDNGIGFNLNEVMKKGMGLTNLKTRVENMNGELTIDAVTGKGATFIIELERI